MRKILFTLLLIGAFVSVDVAQTVKSRIRHTGATASVEEPPPVDPPPVDPDLITTHPRILLTQANIPSLKTKAETQYLTEYQDIVNSANLNLATSFAQGNWSNQLSYDVVGMCYIYAIGDVTGAIYGSGRTSLTYGQRAVQIIEGWRTRTIDQAYYDGGARTAGEFHNIYPVMAFAYDWCFPLLNSTQKHAMVYDDYDSSSAGVLGSATGWHKGLRDTIYTTPDDACWSYPDTYRRVNGVVAGIAYAGDGVDDSSAATLMGRYTAGLSDSNTGSFSCYSFYSGTDGGFKSLSTYSTVEQVGVMPLFFGLESWRTSHGLTRAQTWGTSLAYAQRYYPKWQAYRIRPWAKVATPTTFGTFPSGRNYILYSDAVNMQSPHSTYLAYNSAVGLSQIITAMTGFAGVDNDMAGLARWLLANRTSPIPTGYGFFFSSSITSGLILGSKDATAKSPSEIGLPLAAYFQQMGQMIFRTGWDSVNDSYFTYTGLKWHGGGSGTTEHVNGTFTIDRNGPLLIHAGSGGHHAYTHQSYSDNIPIFFDPADTMKGGSGNIDSTDGVPDYPFWDEGGQRNTLLIDASHCPLSCLTDGSRFDFGGITRYKMSGTGNRVGAYIFSNMTPAYNSTTGYWDSYNSRKVVSATRQIVYYASTARDNTSNDVVFMFDRLTTPSTSFLKREWFHFGVDPVINGTPTVNRTGLTTYAGASQVVVTNTNDGSDGKLYITPLIPATMNIRKVGGPNGSGSYIDNYVTVTDSHEFEDPNGEQLHNQFQGAQQGNMNEAAGRQYYGTHHIEMEPTVAATYDPILLVFEFGTSGMTLTTPELWTGDNFYVARVGSKVASFGKTESTFTGYSTFQKMGTFTATWADISGTTHTITCGSSVTSVVYNDTGASLCGGASFSINANDKSGEFTVVVSTDGTGANNRVTIN